MLFQLCSHLRYRYLTVFFFFCLLDWKQCPRDYFPVAAFPAMSRITPSFAQFSQLVLVICLSCICVIMLAALIVLSVPPTRLGG